MAKLDLVVKTVVEGKNNLTGLNRDLDRTSKKAGKLGSAFSGVGSAISSFINPTALAVGGVAALAGGLAIATKAALDEEKGIAALTASLRANDPAGADHLDQVEDTIKAREKLAFADDEQRESLARLVSVTKDTSKALDLQRQAMDLARLRGIDLATASDIIGKVYGGNIGILSRYGIQLERGTSSTEALAEIQRRAAGQAEEFANTTEGTIQSLGIVFQDLVEDIGKGLLPILKDLALFARDTLIPALGAVGDAVGFFGDLIRAINPVGAAAENLANDIKESQERQQASLKRAGENWEDYSNAVSMSVDGVREGAQEIAAIPVEEIEARWGDIRQAAFQGQVEHAKGILDGQNELKVAIEVFNQLREEEMTEAERLQYLSGLAQSQRLASGILDEREGVSTAAAAITAEVQAELAELGVTAYGSGLTVGANISAGIYANAHLVDGASSYLASRISGYLPRSDAKWGPLSTLSKVGPAIVHTIVDGMRANLSAASAASGGLASSLSMSPLAASGALSGASTGGGSGLTVNLTVQGDLKADERTLPSTIARGLFVSGLAEEYVL